MKTVFILSNITSVVFLAWGCGCFNENKNVARVENAPAWGVETTEEEPVIPQEQSYTPKATFTSVARLCSLLPDGDFELGTVNGKLLGECYYTGDTSTPFLASFAERWNRFTFLRRFVNAEEVFERENSSLGDSLTTETVRGKMPMLPNEYQLAFRNEKCRSMARRMVKLLTTINYVPAECDKMAMAFRELVEAPNVTPDFITQQEYEQINDRFWELYDKSRYVPDIEQIQLVRVKSEFGSDELEKQRVMLSKRYNETEEFNSRCILAIELACCGQENGIDYLGELLEAKEYSPYLFEVWTQWRLRAQSEVFGISTFSEIPDNLYDQVRLVVATQYVKHISANPEDGFAKLLLWNLMCTENVHRMGGLYGNEALAAVTVLKEQYFLPEELIDD